MRDRLLVLLLGVTCACGAPARSGAATPKRSMVNKRPRPALMGTSEVLRMLQESEVSYGLSPLDPADAVRPEAFAEELWPLAPAAADGEAEALQLGSSLTGQGRISEALDAYAAALAARPSDPQLLDAVEANRGALGVSPVREFFQPRGLARSTARGVQVLFDRSRPYWVAYAACKALWLGEPRHRLEMTGSEVHQFSSIEEVECLGALLEAYVRELSNGELEQDAQLERLGSIAAQGQLEQLVLYALQSRVQPRATEQLSPPERQKLERFVRRLVFETKGGKGAP